MEPSGIYHVSLDSFFPQDDVRKKGFGIRLLLPLWEAQFSSREEDKSKNERKIGISKSNPDLKFEQRCDRKDTEIPVISIKNVKILFNPFLSKYQCLLNTIPVENHHRYFYKEC